MRIWALASCGGLLALAACSAEQSNTLTPSAAPPEGDDAAQVTARPRATASSPTTRPDVRAGQSLQNRVRLSSSASRPASTAPQPPSSSQLRERVQLLRAQQGSRLAPGPALKTTPVSQVTNTPLYASLQAPTPPASPPLPRASSDSPENSAPENFTGGFTGRIENAPRSVSQPPPAPLAFTPAAPIGVSAPLSDTTTDLGPAGTVNGAYSYPLAPLPHQGQGSGFQRQSIVLTAPAAPAFTVARVHGGTPAPLSSPPIAPSAAAATPETLSETPSETPSETLSETSPVAATDAETLAVAVSSIPAEPAEAATIHQSTSGSAALTLARQSTVEATPDNSAEINQSRSAAPHLAAALATAPSGATPRSAQAAIAERPRGGESLPLSPVAPRLSAPQPLESQVTPIDQATRPETTLGVMAELAAAEALPDSPVAPAQVSQAEPETLVASPGENPKDLIAAYCLTTSGVALPLGGEAQGSAAPLPKFSPSSQTEASFDLGAHPEKAEVALCSEASSLVPADEATLEPALIAN